MAPAALIIVGETGQIPLVLGDTLMEFQLRRAQAAGVTRAVLFVQDMPQTVVLAIDRLRREGLAVEIARNVDDVTAIVHDEDRVVLIAANIVLSPVRLRSLATAKPPTLLCIPNDASNIRYELIDAETRWSGFALVDGAFIRRTANMVGDWDFASTVMRSAVQACAARLSLTSEEAASALRPIGNIADVEGLTDTLLATAGDEPFAGAGRRLLTGPASRSLVRLVIAWQGDAQLLAIAGATITGTSVSFAIFGWLASAALMLLLGLVIGEAGDWLAEVVGRSQRRYDQMRSFRSACAIAASAAAGARLLQVTGQWGVLIITAALIGSGLLMVSWVKGARWSPAWRGDESGYAAMFGFGALCGAPLIGLAGCAAWAIAGLWAMQRRVLIAVSGV